MNALTKQVGGNHYSKLAIQPMHFSLIHDLNSAKQSAIKYVTRYKDKGTASLDLHKAVHCLEILITVFGTAQAICMRATSEDIALEYCKLNYLTKYQTEAIVEISTATNVYGINAAIKAIEAIIEHEGFE